MSHDHREQPWPEHMAESPPVKVAARLSSLVWWFLLVVLLVFALYAGVGRQLTGNVDAFADDLAEALSARIGHDVAIGSLSSRWFWLDPSFTARNISISNPDSDVTVARVDHLQVRFDFLSSLLRMRVVFEDFEVDGVELALNQSESGQVEVRGAELPEPVNHRLKDWLDLAGKWLSEPYVKITRLSLGIRDNQGNVRTVDVPQLDLVYRKGLFRASGRAIKSGTTEQLASFSLIGKHFFRGDFTGQLYLDVNSGRLFDGLIDDYQWRSIRVEGFDLGGEAWLTFRDGELLQVTGTVRTPYLQLGVGQESLAPIENIRARFGWRRSAAGARELGSGQTDGAVRQSAGPGEWHLKQLEWTWNGNQVSPFSLRLMPEEGGVTVIADALPLGPTRRLLSRLPILPERGADALENYRPRGYLDRVSLWLPERGDDDTFELTGQLRDLSVEAYQGAPGVNGLSGMLYVARNAGYVQIDTADTPARLSFPQLYENGWAFSQLDGLVAWQLEDGITRVFSDNIRMTQLDGPALTGAFDLKLNRAGEDNLGLKVGLEGADESALEDFIPSKVVSTELYDWLTTSITRADVTSGVYYGHGQIGSDAPPGSFVSSMEFNFENASVRYDSRWPEVTDARGQVVVNGLDTRVTLDQAQTGGLSLDSSNVTVVPGEQHTVVVVDAAADVPGEAVRFWMDNSPLGEMAGSEAQRLEFGGQYRLGLGISLPLGGEGEVSVDARVSADKASVSYPPAGLVWEEVSGELAYQSAEGISGAPLTARFLDAPVRIHLSSSASAEALSIRQTGQYPMAELLAAAGVAPGRTLGLSGTLDYAAGLEVSVDASSRIWVRSDLQGVSVAWPQPLAKSAEESAPLEATIDPLAPGGLAVSGTWENRASFDVLWKPTGLEVNLGHLYLGRHTLDDIQIEALDLGDRWVVTTKSERALGRIAVPDDGSTVMADFERVLLTRDDSAEQEKRELLTFEEQLQAFRDLDMGEWPDVNVSIADLQLDDETLGTWSFKLRPTPYRLAVEGIEGRLKSLTLVGDMSWSIIDDRETSRFAGSVSGGKVADLNSLFGTEIPLTNESTNIELDLDWPGRPDEFSLTDMNGSVSLRLDEGIILEQNNTAQVFRVFNLLNADTLWRRLKLDFSDLYERGVAFDAISGRAQLVDGRINMDPELQVVGPSGAFKLSGSTDIATETLDMRLVVVLPLTQNLPLAALLMGAGAPIGGALFVLDKILGDPLSKLTSASYGVTGTWDDPKVDLRRVFDNGE
ncbi:YhdP family phospholipid transporter [Marinobacter apostichopi]|uniref:YhdP family phospholipid transporter n=1 Tax=Marinobacter apostichopi TaxID=3035454 RepID=UPI00257482F7|nr:AsmA-like C-terminal region-containing protein [Marinobacter sp. LA51]